MGLHKPITCFIAVCPRATIHAATEGPPVTRLVWPTLQFIIRVRGFPPEVGPLNRPLPPAPEAFPRGRLVLAVGHGLVGPSVDKILDAVCHVDIESKKRLEPDDQSSAGPFVCQNQLNGSCGWM